MPWFWDLVQLSTEIPLQFPVSRTLLKQSRNYVFHSNPQYLNLHAWCLGVDISKNKASLWRWQRELLSLRDRQQGPSTSQSGPCLRNGAEKFGGFLLSLCKASLRLLYVPVPRSEQVPFDHWYRTAIVDTLGPMGLHISQSSDLNRLLCRFHRDRPKSSRNLPKSNLCIVLNELTKHLLSP